MASLYRLLLLFRPSPSKTVAKWEQQPKPFASLFLLLVFLFFAIGTVETKS